MDEQQDWPRIDQRLRPCANCDSVEYLVIKDVRVKRRLIPCG